MATQEHLSQDTTVGYDYSKTYIAQLDDDALVVLADYAQALNRAVEAELAHRAEVVARAARNGATA
jgi:hypothetical protein